MSDNLTIKEKLIVALERFEIYHKEKKFLEIIQESKQLQLLVG